MKRRKNQLLQKMLLKECNKQNQNTVEHCYSSPGVELYVLQNRLLAKIFPEKCRSSILSTKLEIRLAKAETINWTSLEYDKKQAVPQKAYVASDSGLFSTLHVPELEIAFVFTMI